MKYKSFILILVVFGGAYALLNSYPEDIAKMNQDAAARRQINFICSALESNKVSSDEVCSTPIPAITPFARRYEYLRQQDEAWYKSHGWLYYPTVACKQDKMVFKLMDKNFTCES